MLFLDNYAVIFRLQPFCEHLKSRSEAFLEAKSY